MKKTIALLLILSLALALFSGCGTEEAYVPTGDALLMEGEEPTEAMNSAAQEDFSLVYRSDRSLNPLVATDTSNRALFSLIYQGLFSIDRDYTPVPILCKEYRVSPDNREYTYYIEKATFSDGTPLTIQDVLATYEAAKAGGYYQGRFTHIKEMAITEDGGIRFTLNTAYEDLSILLDIPILKASELEEDHPLGTGPYVLKESLAGAQLVRNPSWWCLDARTIVNAESIPLIHSKDDTQIRDLFEFSDVGIVCANPCSDSFADYRCDYELWDCENGVMLYLGFNMSYSVDDIFADDSLRAAITYAIDRQRLVDTYYNGFAQVATLPASPRSPYYSKTLAANYEFDSLRFIDVLSKTDIPDEPLRLIVNEDDSVRLKVAHDIANTLTEFGLPTEVKQYNSYAYAQIYYASNFDLYLGQVRLSPNMDLSAFFSPLGNLHFSGTDDAATYSLCKDALANRGNYYNLHQQVMTDGRICPILFHSYNIYAVRGLVTDLTPSRDNVYFYTLGKTYESIQLETIYDEE